MVELLLLHISNIQKPQLVWRKLNWITLKIATDMVKQDSFYYNLVLNYLIYNDLLLGTCLQYMTNVSINQVYFAL